MNGAGPLKRRDFLTIASGMATLYSLSTAAAQAPRHGAKVGFLGTAADANAHILRAFRQGLRELGYVEGQTIELEVRWTEGHFERIPELVAELVRLKVDVLVMANSAAALAAKKSTRTIPIVMFAGDPVGLGLVASLARPGGNITGLSYYNVEINAKRLEFLKDLVPRLTRIAVLRNPWLAVHAAFWAQTRATAESLRLKIRAIDVRSTGDFEAAFAAAVQWNAQAILALDDPLTVAYRTTVVALAAHNRLPATYGFREFTADGGLISYGASFVALFKRAASIVDKILKGTKPANIPIEQATKFELVINGKTAQALGITVPVSLLARADEVLE